MAAHNDAYHELFHFHLDPRLVDEIRDATNGNYVAGNSQFQKQVAQALGRRVVRGKPGRSKKIIEKVESQDLFGDK